MIDESRRPPTTFLPLFAIADVDVCRAGIAEVVAVECTVSIQFLGIDDADGVALLATNFYPQPACNVLTDIN